LPAVVNADGIVKLESGTWSLKLTGAADAATGYADAAGGVMTLTCAGAAEDGGQLNLGGVLASPGVFFPAATKKIWFEAKVHFTNLGTDQLNAFVGLVNPVDTEWLPDGGGGAMGVQNVIGWVLGDAETNWSFVGSQGAAEAYNDCGAACDTTDDAWHYLGFMVDGLTSVTCYWDRVAIAAGAQVTANIPIVGLMPGFAIKAGDTDAEELMIDWIQCVELR